MIPNSAPMAAVIRHDSCLISRPVVAWDPQGYPLFWFQGPALDSPESLPSGTELLGLWPYDWRPTYDEMASLLPEHVPDTPHPLAVKVTVREIPGGWAAFRTTGGRRIVESVTYDQMEAKLSALGNFHIESVVQAEPDEG